MGVLFFIITSCKNKPTCQQGSFGQTWSTSLLKAASEEIDSIFKLPLERKLGIPRKTGLPQGYSGGHAERFTKNLTWNETFTFDYYENDAEPLVVDHFKSVLGQDFECSG